MVCYRIKTPNIATLSILPLQHFTAPPALGAAMIATAEPESKRISAEWKHLKSLKFSSGHTVTDGCLVSVVTVRFPYLQVLNLTNCRCESVTFTGFAVLCERMKYLRALLLRASQVSKAVTHNLKANYQNVTIIV